MTPYAYASYAAVTIITLVPTCSSNTSRNFIYFRSPVLFICKLKTATKVARMDAIWKDESFFERSYENVCYQSPRNLSSNINIKFLKVGSARNHPVKAWFCLSSLSYGTGLKIRRVILHVRINVPIPITVKFLGAQKKVHKIICLTLIERRLVIVGCNFIRTSEKENEKNS